VQLGFIGTGEITASIVTGLHSFGATPHTIQLSPRNPAIANKLAGRFGGIGIASCNQEVLDHSDIIVIAVRQGVLHDCFWGLPLRPSTHTAQCSFQSLAANHATAGGINEQFLKHLVEHGLLTSVSEALDAILHRISTESLKA